MKLRKRNILCVIAPILLVSALTFSQLQARSEVKLVTAPPVQLTAGQTATICFSSTHASEIQAQSSDKAIADIQLQRLEGNLATFLITAHADGGVVLSAQTGKRPPTRYAVSVVAAEAENPVRDLIASKGGSKFHIRSCSFAKRIHEENQTVFSTPEEAAAAGYTPCAQCIG